MLARCPLLRAPARLGLAVLLSVLAFGAPGSAPAALLEFVEVQLDGVDGVDGLGAAATVALSRDGAHVYVAAQGDDAIAVFARSASDGTLSFVEAHFDGAGGVDGLDGARSAAVSPDGAHVYTAAEIDDAIAVFARDAASGALGFVEVQRDGIGGADGLGGASSLALSPDGAHLYAAGGVDDAIAVFARNPATGALSFVEAHFDGAEGVEGLDGAFAVEVSPDGAHVYTAAFFDSALSVFGRDPQTGALTFVAFEPAPAGTTDVTLSPDGAHAYAAGAAADAMAAFRRDALTGELSLFELHVNGFEGVEGLNGVRAVVVSPDGTHVYAAGEIDDAIAAFRRDEDGELVFVEVQRDGLGGVDGLDGPESVVVSPEAAHVYVGAEIDSALAGFRALVDTDADGSLNEQDSCPFAPNPLQEDNGGPGSPGDPLGALQDGIGDACQCGDVTGEGRANADDAASVRAALANGGQGVAVPERCNVAGPHTRVDDPDPGELRDDCNLVDVVALGRALAGLAPGIDQVCEPAVP